MGRTNTRYRTIILITMPINQSQPAFDPNSVPGTDVSGFQPGLHPEQINLAPPVAEIAKGDVPNTVSVGGADTSMGDPNANKNISDDHSHLKQMVRDLSAKIDKLEETLTNFYNNPPVYSGSIDLYPNIPQPAGTEAQAAFNDAINHLGNVANTETGTDA